MGGGGSSYRKSSSDYSNPISNLNTGSGIGGGTSFENSSEDDCINLTIETRLLSPQLVALSNLEVGDVLSVKLHASTGRIEVFNSANELCGQVISPDIVRLANCIKKGSKFLAVIINLAGNVCDVRIENKN